MAAESSLGEQLLSMGWRGGSVFHSNAHGALSEVTGRRIEPDHWVVVISQTCDIVARRIDQEPVVEILICTPIPSLRSEFKNLRSTRRLDFRPNRDTHPDIALSAHAVADRFHVPRNLLVDMASDDARSLSEVAYRRITSLYSLRYTRPAWPDAFVQRLTPAKAALVAALEPLSEEITDVRIQMTPADIELTPGYCYSVAIFFVVDESLWNSDPGLRRAVQRAFTAFIAAIRACREIEVNEELSAALSGADFSWQLTQQTQLWNFAFLSDRDSE